MEETKIVTDETLECYTPLMKAWFEEQVNAVPTMDISYDEENRILEFAETTSSGSAGTTIETYTLKFPKLDDVSTIGQDTLIYFTNANLVTTSYRLRELCTNGTQMLVLKKSILVADEINVLENTLTFESGLQAIKISNYTGNVYYVTGDVTFTYADNAPA